MVHGLQMACVDVWTGGTRSILVPPCLLALVLRCCLPSQFGDTYRMVDDVECTVRLMRERQRCLVAYQAGICFEAWQCGRRELAGHRMEEGCFVVTVVVVDVLMSYGRRSFDAVPLPRGG